VGRLNGRYVLALIGDLGAGCLFAGEGYEDRAIAETDARDLIESAPSSCLALIVDVDRLAIVFEESRVVCRPIEN
jgi:hypothetical protein